MFNFNKNFHQEQFITSAIIVDNFINDKDLEVLKKYYSKHGSFTSFGVTNNEETNESFHPLIHYDESELNKDYRNSLVLWIRKINEPDIKQLYTKICSKLFDINAQVFKYKLTDIEPFQYTIYNKGHFYKKHIDIDNNLLAGGCIRKLSFSIQLSDEKDYDGGELCLYNAETPFLADKKKCSATIFPSFAFHEVLPVTNGKREALVGWVWGPRFI